MPESNRLSRAGNARPNRCAEQKAAPDCARAHAYFCQETFLISGRSRGNIILCNFIIYVFNVTYFPIPKGGDESENLNVDTSPTQEPVAE
jgi:hypothetical protein